MKTAHPEKFEQLRKGAEARRAAEIGRNREYLRTKAMS